LVRYSAFLEIRGVATPDNLRKGCLKGKVRQKSLLRNEVYFSKLAIRLQIY
jgi:hypothetical protein